MKYFKLFALSISTLFLSVTFANADNHHVQSGGRSSIKSATVHRSSPVLNNHGGVHNSTHGVRGHDMGSRHFAGHNFHHMNTYERGRWRGGRWAHEEYMGRWGYWYIVDGMRYFYETAPAPGMLYPIEVSPVVFEVPVTSVRIAPPAPSFVPARQTMRYYCPGAGYAPQVSECPQGWQSVPMN